MKLFLVEPFYSVWVLIGVVKWCTYTNFVIGYHHIPEGSINILQSYFTEHEAQKLQTGDINSQSINLLRDFNDDFGDYSLDSEIADGKII